MKLPPRKAIAMASLWEEIQVILSSFSSQNDVLLVFSICAYKVKKNTHNIFKFNLPLLDTREFKHASTLVATYISSFVIYSDMACVKFSIGMFTSYRSVGVLYILKY